MARSGLAYLREDLRQMADAGTADMTIGTVSYWSDDQLDIVLDKHAKEFTFSEMEPEPTHAAGGSLLYRIYEVEDYRNIEESSGGTAIFYVQDSTGGTVAAANYSADYRNGIVTFTTDQRGTIYYATGYSYDLNAAAAYIWRRKASSVAKTFSFSTDNHSIQREQVYKHYLQMAEYYDGMSSNAIATIEIYRGDEC